MSGIKMWYRTSSIVAASPRREARIYGKFIAIGMLAMTLGACAGSNFNAQTASVAKVEKDLPAPSTSDIARETSDYHIGPLDKLTVTVFGVSDLTTNGQVDGAGNFSMPLIGQVPAMGSTTNELARKIEAALAGRYLRNPQVGVTVTEAVGQLVTVDGSVTKPGQYPVIGRTTLIRMVATAGGMTDLASTREALVFRTVGGQRLVARYDIKDIRGARAVDPEVFGNDLIVIGESPGRKLFKDILAVAPLSGVFYQLTK
jgi:polysaccharide export outer membrane protein